MFRAVKQAISVTIVGASVVGCSAAKFAHKQSALQKSIMEADGSISQLEAEGNGLLNSDGSVSQNESGPDSSDGGIAQPIGPRNPADGGISQRDGTNNEIDLRLICSDKFSDKQRNFKAAVAEGLPVVLAIDGKVCTKDINVIRAIVDKKNFTLAEAKALCPEVLPPSGNWATVELIINGVSAPSERGVIELVYARNNDKDVPAEAADDKCDVRRSPLVIHVASDITNPKPISLSSREDGVFFDLLGAQANHVPVKISWFTNHEYRMLTLPNSDGEVHGIDELFGDNTVGPDGFVADNGYAALAKYDGTSADGHFRLARADGYITRMDPVFERLRLWLDEDFDGVAQPHELSSLQSVGITFIDLSFSTDFAEMDKFGNETKMKSVVGYADGTLDLIFDLWFNVGLGE